MRNAFGTHAATNTGVPRLSEVEPPATLSEGLMGPGPGRRDGPAVEQPDRLRKPTSAAINELGSSQARPISLNRWITSRTVSSSAATSWAMTGTRFPPAEARSIIARR
ncbi:hypothetical protein GCM10010390_38280 [Streptomyces mordarskii]|uniref:Uncharacterized protein n=1 Tax=Streptomyces mordarskii TaxID=1226758 RepID=A0ABP3N090_9ACTN